MTFWTLVRFLHLISAILWVGGQLVLSLVIRPVGMRSLEPDARAEFMRSVGRRYGRMASFGLMPLILATGIALVYRHGVEFGALDQARYATTLTIKITLVFVSFGLAIAHGIVAARSQSSPAGRAIGVVGAVVSVVIVLLAVMLVT